MSKIRMFFYAQRKSQFDPPETASDAKRACIRGTLWADGEDAYLKLDGQHVVDGETMLIDESELPAIDHEEEAAGWHRVQVTTEDNQRAWAYQYRTDPPEDAVMTTRWPLSKVRSGLERARIRHGKDPATGESVPSHIAEKNAEDMERDTQNLRKSAGIAKPNQAPDLPVGKQVSQIEDHKQDLNWKTKNVEIMHKASPVHKATGKLASMIKEHRRLVQVLRSGNKADDLLESVIQAKELAGYEKEGLKKDLSLQRERQAQHLDNFDVDHPNHSLPVKMQIGNEPMKHRSASDDANDAIRPDRAFAGYNANDGVEGEDDHSPLTKAIVPEGNAEAVERSSRIRKGNLDLKPRQPPTPKGKGRRPAQGKPGAPLRKSQAIPVSTVAVICGDHILMGRRRDTKKLIMPGGHADPGEHPEQTARRELYEEAGINAKDLKYLGSEDVVCRDGKVRRINCFVTFGHFNPTNVHDPDQEIEEWLWVPAVQYAAGGIADKLHDEIAEQLHDRKNNILLKLLGIAH